MTRIVFMGTPDAAVPTLEMLAESFELALVVTQPDRPKGRSGRPAPTPVKQAARRIGLPVAQPESAEDLGDALMEVRPLDLGVVVAYGRILRPRVLETPDRGFLNIHFSLLPRWRGAAPVERALMAGDTMTGVTIIKLDEGMDTGPVLTAQAVDIAPTETAGELTERLAVLGARLLGSVIDEYLSGALQPVKQSDEGAAYADKITKTDRRLGVDVSVQEFVNRVRALAPEPAATLEIDGDQHKIYDAAPHDASPEKGTWEAHDGVPVVGVKDGGVALLGLQPSSRNRQSGADWVRGHRRSSGMVG